MTDNTATEGSTLVWVETMTSHPTDGVDEVPTVQVFEPILVGVMCVGTSIELMSRRILDPVLVTSILGGRQDTCSNEDQSLTRYSSSLNMKGVMAQP